MRAEPPKEITGSAVIKTDDYELSVSRTAEGEKPITLPKSNVIAFFLADGGSLIVRPSGTEPKIKMYISAVGSSAENAAEKLAALEKAGTRLLGF